MVSLALANVELRRVIQEMCLRLEKWDSHLTVEFLCLLKESLEFEVAAIVELR